MTIVLGIDPGSRVTGYGLIRNLGNRFQYVASGCIRTDVSALLPQRLEAIFTGVSGVIDEFQPTETAIEKIFMAKNAESALKLGHARGVAMLASVIHQIPIYEYAARKVKQAVVGIGSAEKAQIQHMVRSLLNLKHKPQTDAADALAIAICHINIQHNLHKIAAANPFSRGLLARVDP